MKRSLVEREWTVVKHKCVSWLFASARPITISSNNSIIIDRAWMLYKRNFIAQPTSSVIDVFDLRSNCSKHFFRFITCGPGGENILVRILKLNVMRFMIVKIVNGIGDSKCRLKCAKYKYESLAWSWFRESDSIITTESNKWNGEHQEARHPMPKKLLGCTGRLTRTYRLQNFLKWWWLEGTEIRLFYKYKNDKYFMFWFNLKFW